MRRWDLGVWLAILAAFGVGGGVAVRMSEARRAQHAASCLCGGRATYLSGDPSAYVTWTNVPVSPSPAPGVLTVGGALAGAPSGSLFLGATAPVLTWTTPALDWAEGVAPRAMVTLDHDTGLLTVYNAAGSVAAVVTTTWRGTR